MEANLTMRLTLTPSAVSYIASYTFPRSLTFGTHTCSSSFCLLSSPIKQHFEHEEEMSSIKMMVVYFQFKPELQNERAEEGDPIPLGTEEGISVPLGAEEGDSVLVDNPDSESSTDAEDTLLRAVGSQGPPVHIKESIISALFHAMEGT